MDIVFDQNGTITYLDVAIVNGSASYLDVSIVAPFSWNPSLIAAASTRPGHMAKSAEKVKFDRDLHVNLVPFILETTGRSGSRSSSATS